MNISLVFLIGCAKPALLVGSSVPEQCDNRETVHVAFPAGEASPGGSPFWSAAWGERVAEPTQLLTLILCDFASSVFGKLMESTPF